MSKRKNPDSKKSTPAAKKMSHQQSESIILPPEQKLFLYHQDGINVSSLYLATKLADVHFVFDSDDGSVTRVSAHKNLLAVTSDVFEKMFCGGLKENGDIKIVDASDAAFKEFLQFFYLNDVKLSAEHVASVLYLGNKYNVENCVEACVKFLTDELSNENVCAALSLSILHEQKELTKACEKRIKSKTADILKSAGFLECSKEALAHILQMNQLLCSEVVVFESCMEWVRAKSKQKVLSKATVEEHLGDLYYQIHFASMTPKEFCSLNAKYRAVLSSDFEAIINLITRVDIHSERFNTAPRQVKWNQDDDAIITCNRMDYDSNYSYYNRQNWYDLDTEEKTIFSTSTPLVLDKIRLNRVLFGKYNIGKPITSDIAVEVKIIEARALDDTNDVKVLSSMSANLSSGWTMVSLPHPIHIRPNFFYTISINGFPQGHSFISYDQKSSVTLDSDIKIEFHSDKVVEPKIVGLIWQLQFNKIQ